MIPEGFPAIFLEVDKGRARGCYSEPFVVILSESKDLLLRLMVNPAKNLRLSLRDWLFGNLLELEYGRKL